MRKLNEHLDVIAQITLRADEDDGRLGAVVLDFRKPFLAHVVEWRGGHDAEANEEHVSAWVAQRPQRVKVILQIKRRFP